MQADITITLVGPTYPELCGPGSELSICHTVLMTEAGSTLSQVPNEETDAQGSGGTCSR